MIIRRTLKKKASGHGERQATPSVRGMRVDRLHKPRSARHQVKKGASILDIGCLQDPAAHTAAHPYHHHGAGWRQFRDRWPAPDE